MPRKRRSKQTGACAREVTRRGEIVAGGGANASMETMAVVLQKVTGSLSLSLLANKRFGTGQSRVEHGFFAQRSSGKEKTYRTALCPRRLTLSL